MPNSRPMPSMGTRCHELGIRDTDSNWRIVYRINRDAILLLDVCRKTTERTRSRVIAICRRRLKSYDQARFTRQQTAATRSQHAHHPTQEFWHEIDREIDREIDHEIRTPRRRWLAVWFDAGLPWPER